MQFPVTIGLRRSFLLTIFVLLAHAASLSVAWFLLPMTLLPQWARLSTFALIALSLLHAWRLLPPAFSALRLRVDGSIECCRPGEGVWQEGRVLPGATVHPALIVLPLEVGGRGYRLVMTRGCASKDDLRRLRVWLRWRPQAISSSGAAA